MASSEHTRRPRGEIGFGVLMVAAALVVFLAGCGSDAGNLLGGDLQVGAATRPPLVTTPPP